MKSRCLLYYLSNITGFQNFTMESFGAVLISVYLVMVVAEFGDKTNLIALSLMTKSSHPYRIALYSTIGIGLSTIGSVLIGALLGTSLPLDLIRYLAAAVFIWLGISSLREEKEEEEDVEDQDTKQVSPFRVMYLVALAELGDKSQIFAITAAAASFPLAVFLGSVLGMGTIMFATAAVGSVIFEKIHPDSLEKIAAGLFIIAGLWIGLSTLFDF